MSEHQICKTMDIKIPKKINQKSNTVKQFVSTIDYNYPSLNRKDLSDLSNIDDRRKSFKKLNTNRDWSLNLYNLDIEGSSPRKFGHFFNKEEFINKNSDIEKSSPKKYDQIINKKSFNLTNDDIEFSKPQCVKNTSSRHTNPLEPKYNIVNPPILPMTPPKFMRDQINIDDIKGAKPKKIGNEKNLFKEPIIKEIIKDSWPRKPYIRSTKYDVLDYRDVTIQRIRIRNTNPIKPIYNWSYADNTKSFGPIDGNSPLVYSKFLYKNPFNLTNKDIEGTNTGSKYRILKYNSKNYSYSTKDIPGAQSSTVMRGIITKRHMNPLIPKYKYLGHSEVFNIDNDPYYAGSKSTVHYNKLNNQKIMFNLNNNNQKNNSAGNIEINSSSNDNKNENFDKKDDNILNSKINDKNKILEKNIKIVEEKKDDNQKKDNCNDKNDEKTDLKDFSSVNDKISFDKNNYKKPDIYYGLTHNPFLIPAEKKNITKRTNMFKKWKIPLKPLPKTMKRSLSTMSEDNNYCSKLDNFIMTRNFRQMEKKNSEDNYYK